MPSLQTPPYLANLPHKQNQESHPLNAAEGYSLSKRTRHSEKEKRGRAGAAHSSFALTLVLETLLSGFAHFDALAPLRVENLVSADAAVGVGV